MRFFSKAKLGLTTLMWVIVLVIIKLSVVQLGWEILEISPLYTSALSGSVFILGFLLAGVFADYREAERAPAELRAIFENIWEEARFFKQSSPQFDLELVRQTLLRAIEGIFTGLSYKKNYIGIEPVIATLEELSSPLREMERLGLPANHIVRLKGERSNAVRILLRIRHIQRTQFVPSVYFLAESIVAIIIFLLLFLESSGTVTALVLFGFLTYLFLYIGQLIPILEQPFRQGQATQDDVSLFLLHEFEEKLQQTA